MVNIVPIPLAGPLFPEPEGRPGDWWEPFPIPAADVATHLKAEADRRRLSLDLLAALMLERGLVTNDITECGLDAGRVRAALAATRDAVATPGPGRLHTPYVRMLLTGDRRYEREANAQLVRRDLVLPLRLHDAARALELRDLNDRDSLGEAVSWEIAAATSGLFMREWALRALLVQTASRRASA